LGYATISTTDACWAASRICLPSVTEKHIGFSTSTCFPARAASTAMGQ
jgi:hypothetical protein